MHPALQNVVFSIIIVITWTQTSAEYPKKTHHHTVENHHHVTTFLPSVNVPPPQFIIPKHNRFSAPEDIEQIKKLKDFNKVLSVPGFHSATGTIDSDGNLRWIEAPLGYLPPSAMMHLATILQSQKGEPDQRTMENAQKSAAEVAKALYKAGTDARPAAKNTAAYNEKFNEAISALGADWHSGVIAVGCNMKVKSKEAHNAKDSVLVKPLKTFKARGKDGESLIVKGAILDTVHRHNFKGISRNEM